VACELKHSHGGYLLSPFLLFWVSLARKLIKWRDSQLLIDFCNLPKLAESKNLANHREECLINKLLRGFAQCHRTDIFFATLTNLLSLVTPKSKSHEFKSLELSKALCHLLLDNQLNLSYYASNVLQVLIPDYFKRFVAFPYKKRSEG
jgi:hypothetical protein